MQWVRGWVAGLTLLSASTWTAASVGELQCATPVVLGDAEWLLLDVELNGHRLADFLDALIDDEAQVWLPLLPLVEAAEGALTTEADGRLRVRMGPSLPDWVLDPAAEADVNCGLMFALDHWLVSEAWLAAEYGFDIELTDDRLMVRLTSQRPLPADVRRLRERRWARFGQPDFEPDRSHAPIDMPYVAWGHPRGDVRAALSHGQLSGQTAVNLNAALEVEAAYLSNRLFVSAGDLGGVQTLRWTAGRRSPEGQAFGLPSLYRLEFGDVSAFPLPLQRQGVSGRGVVFSTAPLERPELFDVTVVEGDALPGWDAELYRGAELIDVQRIGEPGRYRFDDVPLAFGHNPLRVVLYGPQGQVQERVLERTIAAGQLRPGERHWRGSLVDSGRFMVPIGQATAAPGQQMSLRTDYGLHQRLTAGLFVGVDDLADGTTVHTGLSLRPALGEASTELIVVRQDQGALATQATVRRALAGWDVSARLDHYGSGYQAAQRSLISPSMDRRWVLRAGSPWTRWGALTFNYDQQRFTDRPMRHAWQPVLRQRWRGLSLTHELQLIRQGTQRSSQYRFLWSQRRQRWTQRAQFQAAGQGVGQLSATALNVSVDYRWSAARSVGLAGSYRFGDRSHRIDARLNQRLGPGQLSVVVATDSAGQWTAGLTYAVGLGRNGRAPLGFVEQEAASGGAARVQWFEDINGDGLFDADIDRPLADVGLRVNGRALSQRSDDDGWVVVSGLSIDRPTRIELDRDGGVDPFLTSAQTRFQMQARPGYTHAVRVALQDGGFANGRVLRAGRPAAAVALVAERLDGTMRERIFSLSDGYFAFEVLAPGRWRVRVADTAVPAGWRSDTLIIDITPGQRIDGLVVSLSPLEAASP